MAGRFGLSIRAAEPRDADGLAELLASAGVPVPRAALAARLAAVQDQPGVVLLAGEWGPPSGVACLHWHATLTAEGRAGLVSLLLVDPERRRAGVGRLLLKAGAQAARTAGCGELRLAAGPGRDDLLAFAAATGFASEGAVLARPLRKSSARSASPSTE